MSEKTQSLPRPSQSGSGALPAPVSGRVDQVEKLARDLFVARLGQRTGYRPDSLAEEAFQAAAAFYAIADKRRSESN